MYKASRVNSPSITANISTNATPHTKSCVPVTFTGAAKKRTLSTSDSEVSTFIPPADHTSQTQSDTTDPKMTRVGKIIKDAKFSHEFPITTESNDESAFNPDGVLDKGGIHGIIGLDNSIKAGTVSNSGDRSFEKIGEQIERHNQLASLQVESCKHYQIAETMLDSDALKLSPHEVAKHFLNTINNLAKNHNLSIERVIEYKKYKSPGFLYITHTPVTTKQNVKEIFVDFILFTEGLLKDQKFDYSDNVGKYHHKQTITSKRINEIDALLSKIFTQQEINLSKTQFLEKPYYYLRELLSDYLFKNYTDLDDRRYKTIGREAFDFFEKILFGNGFFSEFDHFMKFVDSNKQEFIDTLGGLEFGASDCRNFIIAILRSNEKLRMAFNQSVMEPEFNKHWLETLSNMFVKKPVSVGQVTALDHYVNLKFGEELEYNLGSEKKLLGGTHAYVMEFEKHLRKLGANPISYPSGFTFDGHFRVIPFIDCNKWLEMNCTPYHDGEAGADYCLEKVFESVNAMISLGLIDQASGHKHVDALSATRGNPAVLLELQREIESNPYLIRAFGNNDKIVKHDESQWYKLFSDYSDMKELAIERINWMIASYNEKSADPKHEELNSYWLTDSEKLDKLKQFSEIYSHFVQMAPLQQMRGSVGDVFSNKFMAICLLHIPGTEAVEPYSTIEFRFFRCPESMQELKLINQFLKAWFEYIHNRRIRSEPIQYVPDDVKASKDYSAKEVRHHTVQYLHKLGLNSDDYHSFLSKVSEEVAES